MGCGEKEYCEGVVKNKKRRWSSRIVWRGGGGIVGGLLYALRLARKQAHMANAK